MKLNLHSDGKIVVNHKDGFNADIISVIHSNVPRAKKQMREVAKFFQGTNELQTCKKIFKWIKANIKYVKDPDGLQDIKLPSRFTAEQTGDCKSFSLFTASILENLNIPYSFRYTSYSANPTPQHVYIVTANGCIIDAVWHSFNKEKNYTFKKDYPMQIRTLSGLGCNDCGAYNINGVNADRVMIGGNIPMGNIFKKGAKAVKKVASKAQAAVKNTAVVKKAAQVQTAAKNTAVVKAAAKVQTAVKQAPKNLQKAAIKVQDAAKRTGLVKAASKLQNQVKQGGAKTLALAAPRRAYRSLVAVNFRGWATQLNKNRAQAGQIFEKQGGTASELFKSIDAGLKRKAIFPSNASKLQTVNGIGAVEWAAVGATLAIATPIILAFSSIVKGAADTAKSVKDAFGKKKEDNATPGTEAGGGNPPTGQQFDPGSGNYFDPGTNTAGGGSADVETMRDSSSYTKPLLIAAGVFLGAKALKLI